MGLVSVSTPVSVLVGYRLLQLLSHWKFPNNMRCGISIALSVPDGSAEAAICEEQESSVEHRPKEAQLLGLPAKDQVIEEKKREEPENDDAPSPEMVTRTKRVPSSTYFIIGCCS